jgi:hypothetical protein
LLLLLLLFQPCAGAADQGHISALLIGLSAAAAAAAAGVTRWCS